MTDLELELIDNLCPGDVVNVWTTELKTIKSIREDAPNRWRYFTFTDDYVRRYCLGKVILAERKTPH